MAKRSIDTVKRPPLHAFHADPEDPTRCYVSLSDIVCRLPASNSVHDPDALAARDAQLHTQQIEHRRRTGEAL